jgi:hypothetical protein
MVTVAVSRPHYRFLRHVELAFKRVWNALGIDLLLVSDPAVAGSWLSQKSPLP